jgi:hypothetical protein
MVGLDATVEDGNRLAGAGEAVGPKGVGAEGRDGGGELGIEIFDGVDSGNVGKAAQGVEERSGEFGGDEVGKLEALDGGGAIAAEPVFEGTLGGLDELFDFAASLAANRDGQIIESTLGSSGFGGIAPEALADVVAGSLEEVEFDGAAGGDAIDDGALGLVVENDEDRDTRLGKHPGSSEDAKQRQPA